MHEEDHHGSHREWSHVPHACIPSMAAALSTLPHSSWISSSVPWRSRWQRRPEAN